MRFGAFFFVVGSGLRRKSTPSVYFFVRSKLCTLVHLNVAAKKFEIELFVVS